MSKKYVNFNLKKSKSLVFVQTDMKDDGAGALRRTSASPSAACLASYATSQRLPLRGCLPKSRATYCPQDMVIPGHIFFSGAKAALRFAYTGSRSVSLFAAPPATSATVRSPAVRRHEAKAKAAVTSIYLHLLVDRAGDPSDFDVGRLE